MLILLNDVEVIPLKAMFTCTMPYYYTRRDVIQTTSTQYFLTSLTAPSFLFHTSNRRTELSQRNTFRGKKGWNLFD